MLFPINHIRIFLLGLIILFSMQSTLAQQIDQQLVITSNITHKTYRITTYLSSANKPAKGYAVLYLLDGHQTFPIAKQMAQTLSQHNQLIPVLLVAIDYADKDNWLASRAQDYTPPHNIPRPTNMFLRGEDDGGNADKFLAVINTEIKPIIEQKFSINHQHQGLFGHSYGGLFSLHVLFTAPQSFQYYYASSPSVWWDNKVILKELTQRTKLATKHKSPPLIVSVGSLEQTAPAHSLPERKNKLTTRQQVTNAQQLVTKLKALQPNNHSIMLYIFLDKDHGTAISAAIEQVLTHFFHH